jgi:hypothetical protein
MKLRLLPLLASVFLLAACASVPMGDQKQDSVNKSFATKPNTAGLYIYRNESFGAAIRMDVEIDGRTVGQTAAKTYFYLDVPPGKHTITSKSENDDSITADMVAGKLYYVWQEVKMGLLYARTKLHLVPEEEGKRGVLECQLAQASALDLPQKGQLPLASKEDQLAELKALFDKGLISQQVFQERQKKILESE